MCTVDDEDEEDLLMISKSSLTIPQKICRSCDNAAKVVLRKKDAYCESCFLNSSTHKFRAALGKSKMLKAGDKTLLAFTGTQSSTALLHFLYSGLNEEKNKRLIFKVDVLFVDDGVVLGHGLDKRKEFVSQMKAMVKSFNFNIYFSTLSEILSEVPKVDKHLDFNDKLDAQLKNLFDNVKTTTSKEDLLYQLRLNLILKIAGQMSYNKVFTDEIGSDLAIKLLVGMSLGRGDHISAEVGFCDNRNPEIPILRPLKDFTRKEIVFYNVFHGIKPVIIPSLTTLRSANVSIHKTAEKFVSELQQEFPSTVYTIFRTGDKLTTGEHVEGSSNNCILCNRTIKTVNTDGCDVREALEFSKRVSRAEKSVNEFVTDHDGCGDCSCSKSQDNQSILCYSCSLISRDMDNEEYLNKYVIQAAIKESNMKKLKEKISEFLIE